MPTIVFTVCIGIRAPIEPGEYQVRDKCVGVSYPEVVDLGTVQFRAPQSLSTLFVVSWKDLGGAIAKQLTSQSFERNLPIYVALDTVSDLLLAYKLVRVGHADGLGVRTVGIGDALMYFASIDGVSCGNLNLGLKNYAGNNAWLFASTKVDPHGTSALAGPYVGTDSLPVARKYIRCFELLEHGFYSEAFIVAFSVLDDLVQQDRKSVV